MAATELPVLQRQRGVCCQLDSVLSPEHAETAATLLKVLADPTRLSILATLRAAPGPVCICDFTAAYQLGQPTISHHMAKLKSAGLVVSEKRGIWIYYRLVGKLPPPIASLLEAALGCIPRSSGVDGNFRNA
ncbi:MAG TPA: metalloregulator ArsR/SmtB family transcription factor [Candidatus Dormibacteraeota bacterium]|nr:metalloregulator ArsR/SmtB family transcription factor [Candidatus Dormibacteraeota bacterium]